MTWVRGVERWAPAILPRRATTDPRAEIAIARWNAASRSFAPSSRAPTCWATVNWRSAGLSRATVSRLAQTLVDSGMLEHDRRRRAYRLAAPVLSLAHAMRSGSPILQVAGPLMRSEAEQRKINVGLAIADRDEMVYLESVRYSRRVSWRNVVAGQRVPMELTSLGRAWLAVATDEQRSV